MPFFSKVFRGNKDSAAKTKLKENGAPKLDPPKPRWDDAWLRTEVEPDEVRELLRGCTQEVKARALDAPFLLLPFRPASDPSAAKTFVRNYFGNGLQSPSLQGESLVQELRLVEPMVLCSVLKWCWSRLPGGIVTWEAYELFQIGEQDSNQARDAFATFIPISVASDARANIIFDFFELLAAIAAHGKVNGLAGRKLSRLAGWWAFEHSDTGNGFEGGYKNWLRAADATSHLFFAYLRSLTPDSPQGITGISNLPRSLQALLASTEYPPVAQDLLQSRTSKVVMVVETVSPTPFALLRRAKNFQYRDDDVVLQRFSDYEDPVDALTDECRRVLRSISNANDSSSAKESTSLKDPSWSRFEDMGFGSFGDDSDVDLKTESTPNLGRTAQHPHGLRTTPLSNNLGRPTTPSWADFLSSGFVDEKQTQPTLLLPPDKVLPPINVAMRGHSSQSHRRTAEESSLLEPGELANIAVFALDDAFWWVWITSLSGEEPPARKAAFGRCALIETRISKSWLVMEEIIKGAAPEPEAGAYVAEKKSRFGFSKRSKMSRTKSTRVPASKIDPIGRSNESTMPSKTSIAPDQRSRIQAAAAALQEKNRREAEVSSPRRARHGEEVAAKTTSTLTLQPVIVKEAAPAMKWASSYDKNTIRSQYLGNNLAGRGSAIDLKDVLESSANSTRSATTPNPAAPPAKPDDGIPMVEKPLPSEPAPASITELPQETPNEPAVQNGTAGGLSADDFFASQLPAVVKPTSAELSPARPSPAEVEEVKPAAPIQQERKPLAPVVPSTMPPEPPQDREEPAQQYPRPMERSAFSPLQQAENRQLPDPSRPPKTPDQSATPASPIIQAPASPESPRNKLKKRNPPIGFKGMFSRRKFDEQSRAAAKPVPKQAPNSSSVAAARAALEAKAKQSQAAAPPQTNKVTTKRFSTLANKGPVVESAAAQATAARTTNQSPVVATRAPPPVPARQEESPAQAAGSQPPVEHQDRPISTTDTTGSALDPVEEQRAATEFGTFDQGPLEENPYNLEESPTRTSAGAEHEEATPIAPTHEEAAASAEPVAAADESNEAPGDRWAQIRKNAAERAARMSEDQTGVVDKTDDGETDDGEETIESRVARIKARVAELTGNMDQPRQSLGA